MSRENSARYHAAVQQEDKSVLQKILRHLARSAAKNS
jgi:hypothetical protein